MFNLGMGEITIILVLALIILGPGKLPELAAGLGRIIREIRKATSDVKNEIALDDTFRKPFEDLRDAVTLHPDELKRRDRIRQEMEEVRKRAEEASAAAEAAETGAPAQTGDGSGNGGAPADATIVQAVDANGTPVEGEAPAHVAPAAPLPAPGHAPHPVPAVSAAHEAGGQAGHAGHEAPAPAHAPPPPPPMHAPEPAGPSAPWANASAVVPPPPAQPLFGSPPGTVARAKPSTLRRVPPLGPTPGPPGPPPSPSAHVVPPVSAGDAANKTQVLSENDLMPSAPSSRAAVPPPPPGAGSGRHHAAPPPLPGSTAPGSGPHKKTQT